MSSDSNKSNSLPARTISLAAALAVGASMATGCTTVGRTNCSIGQIDGVRVEDVGGPWYVVDETGGAGMGVRRGLETSEMLHEACQRRYPEVFSRKRSATPLLVVRKAQTEKELPEWDFSDILFAYSAGLLPKLFPRTGRIADRVDIQTGITDDPVRVPFSSTEQVYVHGILTRPFASLLTPASKGWSRRLPVDHKSPESRLGPERLDAYADAIVKGLAGMDAETRNKLKDNPAAWAGYWRVRPYRTGEDVVPMAGTTVREIPVVRPGGAGRLPSVKSFAFDSDRRVGRLACNLAGCDSLFAQKWTVHRALPARLRKAFPLPGERAVRIDAEELSPEGLYTIDFTVVE